MSETMLIQSQKDDYLGFLSKIKQAENERNKECYAAV